MLYSILAVILAAVVLLILALFARYLRLRKPSRFSSDSDAVEGKLPDMDFDGFTRRFQRMIQIPTVSWTDLSKIDTARFAEFQQLLVEMYPGVHQSLERTVVGDFGLIYKWPGTDSTKKPVLFLAHYDVVPAEESGDEVWETAPFSGEVKDGVLWGRGTLDDKFMIAFYLETVESYLSQGWQPKRDIYFAFGGDEETGGNLGAGKMAAMFKEQGLEFEFVMDEGGIIAKDQLAFLKGRPVALVGIAEKGFLTLKIKANGVSGHSSMPGKDGTAIGKLAKAVIRLEKRRFPTRLDPIIRNMLERFVPYISVGLGLVFSNLWLFAPLIRYIFSKKNTTDSLIRTTQAVTVFHSGEQENILPGEAVALVNTRILSGWTMAKIINRYQRLLKDLDLEISDAGNWPSNDPIQPKSINSDGFQLIGSVLAKTHPDAILAPYMMTGSTDSKAYGELTDQILRFIPLVLKPEDLASMHGINEKVSLENLKQGLSFYYHLFNRL